MPPHTVASILFGSGVQEKNGSQSSSIELQISLKTIREVTSGSVFWLYLVLVKPFYEVGQRPIFLKAVYSFTCIINSE